MSRVLVLNHDKTPLSPCRPAKARILLNSGKAAVFRKYPFTIILKKQKKNPKFQDTKIKVDPGSNITGLALILKGEIRGWILVWAANLEHRGQAVKHNLEKRSNIRKGRRNRKTRHRKPRFLNRSRPKGWLPPSLMSRVNNIITWVTRLQKFCHIKSCVVETVRFDTQKMQNPEIRGIQYQQGELQGYDVREYLLEKYDRTCVYCNKSNTPLEVEHVVPKSRGGSNRVSNLVLSCTICNQKKGNKTLEEFLKKKPKLLRKIKRGLKQTLKDTASVNATRNKVKSELRKILKTYISTGSITKYNRTKQKYPKDHYVDAACCGKISGRHVIISKGFKPYNIKSIGRGHRRFCLVDKYGFPRTKPRQRRKKINNVQSNDIVKVFHIKGNFIGKVVLSNNAFIMKVKNNYIRFKSNTCKILHKEDGYSYSF